MSINGLKQEVVSIPFTGGVENKLDPVLVGKEKLLSLVNYTFAKNGSLSRRSAWTSLSGVTLTGLATQAELFSYGNELMSADSGESLYSYAPNATSKLVNRGGLPYCSLRKDQIYRGGGLQSYLDSATASGITCYAWVQTTLAGAAQGIYCSIVDETTGAVIVNDLQVYATTGTELYPRVCAVNGVFCIFFADATNIKMVGIPVGGTAITVGPLNTVTTFNGPGRYDVVAVSGGALVVFDSTALATQIGGWVFDNTGASLSGEVNLITSVTMAGRSTCIGLALYDSTHVVAVVGASSTTVRNLSLLIAGSGISLTVAANADVTVAAAPVAVTAAAISSTSARVFTSPYTGGAGIFTNQTYTFSTAGAASAAGTLNKAITAAGTGGQFGPSIVGKAIAFNGIAYVPMSTNSTLQPSWFLVESNGNVLARALDGVYGSPPVNGFLPSTPALNANVFSIPSFEYGTLSLESGAETTQTGVSRIRVAFMRTYASSDYAFVPLWHAQAAKCAYLSGAVPSFYDGAQIVEAGFHWYPEGITAATGAAGSPNGTYLCCAVYEWTDNQGQRHQSTPSPAVSVTVVNQRVVMVAPTLQLGARLSGTTIAFYRTLTNGTTFYRDSPVTTAIANSTTSATVSYTSNVTDATLETREILYNPTVDNTGGGTLFNNAPPACRVITAHQDRLVIAGLEDPYEFRYSQQSITGVGLQWNELLTGHIPQGFGEITAAGVLDDKLILYTPTRKFVVIGDGLLPDGSGTGYGVPQLLPTDTGCIDQRTVANIPDVIVPDTQSSANGGQVFQSKHGIYKLTRSLTDEYIGSAVEDDVLSATLTSAVVLEDKAQLRFSSSSGSKLLVYDYLFGQWSVFSGASVCARAACVWNGTYTMADSGTGGIVQDLLAESSWKDFTTTVIVGSIQTSWLKAGAIDGFQRIWQLFLEGTYYGDSGIVLAVAFDYDSAGASPGYSATSFATSTLALSSGKPLSIRHQLKHQKCAAVRFTITDTPSPTGAASARGTEFSGLTLEMGLKRGTRKVPATQSL